MLKQRSIKYPPGIKDDEHSQWETEIITKCIGIGRSRMRAFSSCSPLPGVFDSFDIESAFMKGVFDGLCRVEWDKGDPVEYLINSGIWLVRTERYRAIKNKMEFRCQCGRELEMSEIPCHNHDGVKVVILSESECFEGPDGRLIPNKNGVGDVVVLPAKDFAVTADGKIFPKKRNYKETMYGDSKPKAIMQEREVLVPMLSTDTIERFGGIDGEEEEHCEQNVQDCSGDDK